VDDDGTYDEGQRYGSALSYLYEIILYVPCYFLYQTLLRFETLCNCCKTAIFDINESVVFMVYTYIFVVIFIPSTMRF